MSNIHNIKHTQQGFVDESVRQLTVEDRPDIAQVFATLAVAEALVSGDTGTNLAEMVGYLCR